MDMTSADWDEDEDDYDSYFDDPDHYAEQDERDDWYDDDDREPDEPDWGYEAWRAEYEEHCIQAHGGQECNCRPSLRERLREVAGNLRRRIRHLRRKARRDWDIPPF